MKWLTPNLCITVAFFTLAFLQFNPFLSAIGYVGGFIYLYRTIDDFRRQDTYRKW